LALAAGTLGLGPTGARTGVWDAGFVQHHGGVVGEAIYTAVAAAAQQAGAHVLAIFLFCAALLLLTGATVAGVVRGLRAGAAATGLAARAERAAEVAGASEEPAPEAGAAESALQRPEDGDEPGVTRARPADPTREDPARPGESPPNGLTPQGRYRGAITDDPD